MSKHIIPYDHFNHIEDVSCGCNPTITVAEGEEMYIHKEIPNKLEFVVENKHYWLSFEDYEKVRKFRGYSGSK